LAFSRDGRFVAAATADGVVELWNLGNGALLASLRGHEPQVEGILFSPDGTLLASRGFDRTIRLWGIPPTGASVVRSGISVSDQGSGLIGDVPTSWLAQGISPARYQIDLVTKTSRLMRCPYTNNHTLYLEDPNVTATVTDLEDNHVVARQTFNGKYDSPFCPSTYTFGSATAVQWVGRIDDTEFVTWLQKTMTPLGFSQ